jgi:hypothetical protein
VDRHFLIDAVAWISGKILLAWDNRESQASDGAVKRQNDL